ncbi:unnamed protein product [Cercospora beticola]|nr:unnamed protein product [Cercospora beticola]
MAPKKASPKKSDAPKKGRKPSTKTRDAALAEQAATTAPAKRTTRQSPEKTSPAKPARKAASPTKITKKASPVKPAAKPATKSKAPATKTQTKDTQFRGPASESDRGYKTNESTADIIKAIDGRTLTSLDKRLVEAIDAFEANKRGYKTLSNEVARYVATQIETRPDDQPSTQKIHFQIYWRFRKLFEQKTGPWPVVEHDSTASGDESDEDEEVIESVEKLTRGGRKSKAPAATAPSTSKKQSKARSSRPDGGSGDRKEKKLLKDVEDAVYAAALEHQDDESDDEQATRATRQKIEAAQARGVERARHEAAMRAENALHRYAHSRGQVRNIPEVDETGVVRSPQRGSARARALPPAPPAKTPELPSPSKAADPRKAEQDRKAREAKRKADVQERKAVRDGKKAFPPNKTSWTPYCSERGKIVSSTNPPLINIVIDQDAHGNDIVQERVNPFFETLPGPEVWHRNMPPYFSFGETKYMEQVISDQINRDLNRKHSEPPKSPTKPTTESVGLFSTIRKSITSLISPSKQANVVEEEMDVDDEEPMRPLTKRKDQWELPELSAKEKDDLMREARKNYQQFVQPTSPTRKRSSTSMQASPRAAASTWGTSKKPRR